jgi:hypothetical protein
VGVIKQVQLLDIGLCDPFREELIRRSTTDRSAPSSSGVGSWQTRDDLFLWDFEPVRWLHRQIQRYLLMVEIAGWGVVSRRGSYTQRHQHVRPGYRWSGIFYLDDSETPTVFDPDGTAERTGDPFVIVPERCLLVLYPSEMWHWTEPHGFYEPRVTISFDAR